jgi:hypothetical protein
MRWPRSCVAGIIGKRTAITLQDLVDLGNDALAGDSGEREFKARQFRVTIVFVIVSWEKVT